jgi:hypothetical protein
MGPPQASKCFPGIYAQYYQWLKAAHWEHGTASAAAGIYRIFTKSQYCRNVVALSFHQIALLTGRVYQDSLGGLQAVRLFFSLLWFAV